MKKMKNLAVSDRLPRSKTHISSGRILLKRAIIPGGCYTGRLSSFRQCSPEACILR